MPHTVDHTAILERYADARGGVHNIWDTIDPAKTAHLVVDMQSGFMEPGAPVEVPAARDVVEEINRLSRAVRLAGGTNVFLRFTTPDPHGPAAWPVFAERMGGGIAAHRAAFTKGAHYWQLWPTLDVAEQDVMVDKHRFSGFTPGTSTLDAELKARGIDTLIISGTLTNCCCESTARDAMQMNYKVIVAADACAALSDEAHAGTLDSMALIFADLRSVAELEGMLALQPALA
ncbi:MAG: cysteine hydrolase [Erythrobacter sp.]|nr:MAG: cysteine hydrolase [Erythrobacter sp.]